MVARMCPARPLNPAEKLDWLRLIRSENVGPVTFYQLLARFGSAAAALEGLPEIARRGGRDRPLTLFPRTAAEREMTALDRAGARLVAWGESDYPPALAAIDDAPPLLSMLGEARILQRPAIAVVGARNASANGRRFARDIALQLGQRGLVVVSGLARGIDAAAHEGALPTGTMAVLAGGIDSIYPEENRALHEAIAERGALLAEMPVGTVPQARHFPRRNRSGFKVKYHKKLAIRSCRLYTWLDAKHSCTISRKQCGRGPPAFRQSSSERARGLRPQVFRGFDRLFLSSLRSRAYVSAFSRMECCKPPRTRSRSRSLALSHSRRFPINSIILPSVILQRNNR
jgi:DNA recombination-mediator protein A/DprA/Smf-like nucleotide binding protein involved in DNA uptake